MKKISFFLLLLLAIISCQKSKSLVEAEKSAARGLSVYLANGQMRDIGKNTAFQDFLRQVIHEDIDETSRNLPLSIVKVDVVFTNPEKSTFLVEYTLGENKNNMALDLENILDTNFDFEKILPRSQSDETQISSTYKTRYKCVRETCNNDCSVRVLLGGSQITCFCGNTISTDGSCSLEIN